MKKDLSDIEIIELFLDGELSKEEQSEFKERLQSDKAFLELYQSRLDLAEKWRQANEYEKTREQVGAVIQSEKKKLTNKRTQYSLAAILVLSLVIPAVVFINKENQLAKSEDNQLQIDEPELEAARYYFDEHFQQLAPIKSQSINLENQIVFKWESSLDVRTAIIIKEEETDSLVWRIPVPSKLKEYKLKMPIKKGVYIWQLEGFEGKKDFQIK